MTPPRLRAGLVAAAAFVLCGAAGAGQAGRVWRAEYSLQAKATVSETVAADGSARSVGRGKAVPWPDGSRFAVTHWDTRKTDVRIIDTASGRQLHGVAFEGYVRDLRPSPQNVGVVALRQGQGTTGKAMWVIADFSQRSFLDRFPADSAAFGWLPDGGFVVVSKSGELRRGTVGEGARPAEVRQLALPPGRTVAEGWIDPQGTRLLLRLDLRPPTRRNESDLWIADLRGGALERYTATGMTTLAAWSPDGRRIAFDVDTGAWCTGSSCQGSCEVWHADANAREVRAGRGSDEVRPFALRGRRGLGQMGCTLLGWTR